MRYILLALALLLASVHGIAATPALTSPTPGSTLSGSSVIFTWSANGTTVQQYNLWVGSTPGANNYAFCVEPGTITSCTVTNLPTNGSPVYVRLAWETGTTWGAMPTAAAFTSGSATPPPPSSKLTGFTCSALSGSTSTCTVTISPAAPSGGFVVTLSSPSPTVSVPPSVTVAAGATTATFPAIVSTVTLTAKAGTVTETFALNLTTSVTVHGVQLNWIAPTSSDPAVSYNIYRSPDGGTAYQQLNTAAIVGLSYSDTTVTSGSTYDYIAKAVDVKGTIGPASNTASVSIP